MKLTDLTREQLLALIRKSRLELVPSVQCRPDHCGKPTLHRSGEILRHKGYLGEVKDYAATLQKCASQARRIYELENHRTP